jgi:cytochrome c-type biogenesis protein CcsB
MKALELIVIIFYLLSAAKYLAYFFYQKEYLHKAGAYLLTAGFLCHLAVVGVLTVQSGTIPVHNLHETLLIAGLAVVSVFLIFQLKYHLKVLGIYAAPLAALVMTAATLVPREPVQVQNIFKSFWLVLHIVAIFIGEASFALACGVGILYLVQEHAIKSKNPKFFFKRLPSLDLLDATGYGCIVVGFALLSLGLVTGFIYAKSVWGKFWSWDPKEVWSGITWILYAALLHQRLTVGWRGRKAAIMSIIGFVVILFTFFGVNFLLQGHHGQFTRW